MSGVTIAPYVKACHVREGFVCGVPALDQYLKTQMSQDVSRGLAACYVASRSPEGGPILGYYTLSSAMIHTDHVAAVKSRYSLLPATLIGRLAVHEECSGQGLGGALLRHALGIALQQSLVIGSAFVLVDAKDERAVPFYAHYGFVRYKDDPLKLYLPMETIRKLPRPGER